MLSGAVDPSDNGSQLLAATRETKEEVGWAVATHRLVKASLSHDFIYQADKPGRGGDRGVNCVFLLNANELSEPIAVNETVAIPKWLAPGEALAALSYDDLRVIMRRAMRLVT